MALLSSLTVALQLIAVLFLTSVRGGVRIGEGGDHNDTYCRYSSAEIEPNDFMCGYSGFCCPVTGVCMSNGLCYLPLSGTYEVHTCTRLGRESGKCQKFCAREKNWDTGPQEIQFCGNNKQNDELWCCNTDGNPDCCSNGVEGVTALPPESALGVIMPDAISSMTSMVPISMVSVGKSLTDASQASSYSKNMSQHTKENSYWSSIAALASSTSSSSGELSTTLITASPESGESAGAVISTMVVTASPGSGTISAKEGTRRDAPTIAGVAVGVPLGLAAVGLVAYVLRRRRRHLHTTTKKAESTAAADSASFQSYESVDADEQQLDEEPHELDTTHDERLDAQTDSPVELPSTSDDVDGTLLYHQQSSAVELEDSKVESE